MINFLSNLISGLSLGSIYALIALGYTMVYGIAKMLNFAHGDIIMVGAYSVIIAVSSFGWPGWLAVVFSILCCVILGTVIEKIAYKPLRKEASLSVLITAIGVSYFLQNLTQLLFGSAQKSFPKIISIPSFSLGALTIRGDSILTLVITSAIMLSLTWFIHKTRMGKAMQAVSEDQDAAEMMGISVNRTISVTFAVGSALAAVAGIFYGTTYGFIGPYSGSMPGIKAFVAAVFGGIGSIPGAMIGGIVLGMVENLSKAYISAELSDAIVFAVLIVVLLFKPTGLLGKKIEEKV